MIVKNGFNIMFFVFITVFAGIISCKNNNDNDHSGELKKADREFSAMSAKDGMIKAFLEFVAEDGVVLRDNSMPSKGKSTLADYYMGRTDTTFTLTWEPLYEKIAASGDLGYTYGIYTNTVRATGEISRGTYTTIWQKQSDGKWKWVLDTGNQGLSEK
jgi:ketosteroid isomerase-like protein